jgi:hypothetical protein
LECGGSSRADTCDLSPGGFEQFFRDIAALEGEPTPHAIVEVASRYGIEADFQRTMPLVERHGLAL